MHRSRFVQSLSAYIAEPTFMVRWLGPAMRHRILDQARSHPRAWRNNVRDTFLMDNKVANCSREKKIHDVSLLLPNSNEEVWRQQKQHAILLYGHAHSTLNTFSVRFFFRFFAVFLLRSRSKREHKHCEGFWTKIFLIWLKGEFWDNFRWVVSRWILREYIINIASF